MSGAAAVNDAWVGSYNPVVLTRVLKRAAQERHTGALSVVSGPSVKTIHFAKGSVKFAASNVRKDRLGESMLAHEFISESDYEIASRRMLDEGCRFGEALLSLGRLTEEELNRELAIQVQRIVLSLFQLPEGMYSFERAESLPAALPFGLSVPPLLLKGLRTVQDGKVILSALPSADTALRVAASPAFELDPKRLCDAERSVLELAREEKTVGEIIRSCEQGRSAAFRSCFALLTLGILEPVPGEASGARPEHPTARAGDASAPLTDQALLTKLVNEQFERLDRVSESDLLGIRPDAPLAVIEQAYEELKAEWADAREQVEDLELVGKIHTIELRLAAAFAQLLVERREGDSPAPEATGATEGGAKTEWSAGAEASPSTDDFAKRSRVQQLERDADLHLQVRDWKGAVSLLHELVALVPHRARYQSMLGEAMQHRSSTRKDAEQHFLEAVRLEPDDPAYRIALGRYYRSLDRRAKALTELERALQMDPGNEEALRVLGSLEEPTRMQRLFHRVFG